MQQSVQRTLTNGKPFSGQKNNLTTSDFDNLANSYITRKIAVDAGFQRVDEFDGAEIVGRKAAGSTKYSGLRIPYYWPGEAHPRGSRLRRDYPDLERLPDGTTKERNKYLSAPGCSNQLYFSPDVKPTELLNSRIPADITEGEKKTLALNRFRRESGEEALVIGLSGVWNWRGTVGKVEDEKGKRRPVKGVINDFDRIEWKGRTVRIIFDANVHSNPSVKAARRNLAYELVRRGADVLIVDLPADLPNVNGVDDLLALKGPEFVAQVLREAKPFDPSFSLTDLGNAERFLHQHGDRVAFAYNAKTWLAFDGQRWVPNAMAQIERWWHSTIRTIFSEASRAKDDSRKDELRKFAFKSEGRKSVENGLAQARAYAQRELETFDIQPFLLNCTNGTLDLRTGEIRQHSPEDYLSKLTPISYEPSAKCPKWLAFLDRVFDSDKELIKYIQKAVGYVLTGDTSEQCLFVCYGTGKNGKTVFLTILSALLGQYATNMGIESLMTRKFDSGAREDIARLRGARLVTAAEAEDGHRFAESLLKQLTGGDTITARNLYQSSFEFKPEFKLWLAVNHRPIIRGTDTGIWRRIRLVPFNVTIPKEEQKPFKQFIAELSAELPGILTWALKGLFLKEAEGFDLPKAVEGATSEYREAMDVLGRFIEEKCEVGEFLKVKSSGLYEEYERWSKQNGEHVLTQTAFSLRIKERFTADRGAEGRYFKGIGLKI